METTTSISATRNGGTVGALPQMESLGITSATAGCGGENETAPGVHVKRTRSIKKWFITIPRVAIREPGIYQFKLKISQVVIEEVKDIPGKGKDRGSVDGEEEV